MCSLMRLTYPFTFRKTRSKIYITRGSPKLKGVLLLKKENVKINHLFLFLPILNISAGVRRDLVG